MYVCVVVVVVEICLFIRKNLILNKLFGSDIWRHPQNKIK